MQFDTIQMEIDGNIAVVTLNRPQKLNALNSQLVSELTQALDKCAKDSMIRVVVLQGVKKYFCVGADISEVPEMINALKGFIFLEKTREIFIKIELFPKPVIASIEGLALGGGFELALACDLRLASESAQFGVPEIEIGAFPAAGGTSRLPRMIGPTRAKEMVFLGERISAHEAYRIGLVNRVFPDNRFQEEVLTFAHKLAEKAPLAIRLAKQSMDQGFSMDSSSSRIIETLLGAMILDTEDRKEGMEAFLGKEKTHFSR